LIPHIFHVECLESVMRRYESTPYHIECLLAV
jgi:hypothetical protein